MLEPQQKQALINAMTHPSLPTQPIDAGYTYLGQFIAHDIVRMTNPKPGDSREATPFLDLDSVYGTAEFRITAMDGDLFLLGESDGVEDLLRDENGVANIPEPRNDDNVIVSQLHIFWQRVHNFIRTRGFAKSFEETRRLTILVYQLVVIEDYLRLVLKPQVFEHYFRRHTQPSLGFSEQMFTHAAFRFGHSMVRHFYEGFVGGRKNTPELFRPNQALTAGFVIGWADFFGLPQEKHVQDAMRIDPLITREMTAVPFHGGSVNVIERNLEAGKSLLPGLHYARELQKTAPLLAKQVGLLPLHQLWEGFLLDLGPLAASGVTIDNLPLWPYLLCEAVEQHAGEHLGTLGSLICAEALIRSIAAAEHSVWRDGSRDLDGYLDLLGDGFSAAIRERLQAVPRPSAEPGRPPLRTFCMRDLIDLVNAS